MWWRSRIANLIMALVAGVSTSGCSGLTGEAPLSAKGNYLGFAPAEITTEWQQNSSSRKTKDSGDKQARVAALVDRAPPGSYEKAPPGAFAHRDYSRTHLDPKAALKMINAYRVSKGLKPLRLDPKLALAAKRHAEDLARKDRISHYGSDGSDPWERLERAGYKPALAAENVGTGQVSLAEVFAGWKKSPGHNANLLLPDATQMGIALVKRPDTEFKTFWVLALGRPQ